VTDRALAALLFGGAALISGITILQGIQPNDEGLMLQAAARVADGQVPYGDFWWFYPPGQPYLLAFLWQLFGPSLLTWRIVRVLCDAPVAPLAGVGDLHELIDGFNSAGTISAALHVEGPVDDLPVEIGSSAYRVVMEALTNVRRHANKASRVDIVLHRTAEWLFVRVGDDGHGGGPRGHSHGFGLVGLHERVGALGGRIQAGPGAGGGWVVDAALPIAKQLQR